MVWAGGCTSDKNEAGGETEGETDTDGTDSNSSDSMTASNTSPSTTMPSTTNSSADGTTTTTDTADTGSESAEVTTDPDGTTTGETTSSTTTGASSSSTGEPVAEDYPACTADDECSDPYTLCWPPENVATPNFCTLECEDADDCPIPSTGTATPVCEGPPGTDVCVLNCADAECPDGMTCVDIFNNGAFLRCTRT